MPERTHAPHVIDLRPILARGEHPLTIVMHAAEALAPGSRLELIAPFEPVPLIGRLRDAGCVVSAKETPDGAWRVEVARPAPPSPSVPVPVPLPVPAPELTPAVAPMVTPPVTPVVAPFTGALGIRTEQGPPLSIPASFFLTAPLALMAAGALVLARGAEGATSLWGSTTVAVVHFGTVGMLLFVMLGALYQMLPVVAGAVVPAVRLAHAVHALLVLGAVLLVHGQATAEPLSFAASAVLVSLAIVLFLAPSTVAVVRSRTRSPTAWGLSLGLAALALVVLAGVRLAWVRAGHEAGADWLSLRAAHAQLGFVVWIGGLITAVSWQVLPMFFFAPAPPRALAWTTFSGVTLSFLLLGATILFAAPLPVAWLALPGALVVWLVHPAWALRALRARKRRRRDATLWFWWLGLSAAPVCLFLGAATAWLEDPRWPLLYGLAVLWGWAGAIAHGMLCRIVPFLVWLHWCAPRVGQERTPTARTPSAKELLPDREVGVGFALHALTLGLGAVAVLSGESLAWRAFGLGLAATGLALFRSLVAALLRGRPKAAVIGAR